MTPAEFDRLLDGRAERQSQQAERDEAAAVERARLWKIAEAERKEAARRAATPPTLAYAIRSADRCGGRDEAVTIAIASLLPGEIAHDITAVVGRGFARSALVDAALALASTLSPGLARSQFEVVRQCGTTLPEEATARTVLGLVGMIHDLRAELASRTEPASANLSVDPIDDLLGGRE